MDYNINELFGYNKDYLTRTYNFLESQRIRNAEKLPSRWRSLNIVLKVSCEHEDYVVKKMSNGQDNNEIERVKLMRRTYPAITPPLFLVEGNDCYTMGYIEGKSFFNLSRNERAEKIAIAGKMLKHAYFGDGFAENVVMHDISEKVREGFERYREKRKQYFNEKELRLQEKDFERFREVPDQLSHNDLNAANLIYNHDIKIIDPSEEGYNDIARDIGRYCASCFFNNYDCFGNDKQHSIEIARAFLESFDETTLKRAKYYVGESFLAFLGFNTETTDKEVLKQLSVNMLTRDDEITNIMEESL